MTLKTIIVLVINYISTYADDFNRERYVIDRQNVKS